MDELFTPEILDKVLGLLDTATVMGGLAIVVYFLVPLIMLIITCTVWLWIIKLVVPAVINMVVRLNTATDVDKIKDKLAAQVRVDLAVLLGDDEELQAKVLAIATAGLTHEDVFNTVLAAAGVEGLADLVEYPHTRGKKLKGLFENGIKFSD